MRWFWRNYLPDAAAGENPLASPLRASQTALATFPATLVITCEYDVLRDEGEQFATRLIQAGVDVTAVRWLGSLHGFLVTESLIESTSAKSCITLIGNYLKDAYKVSCGER
jgi:acetyl esterase/lipase